MLSFKITSDCKYLVSGSHDNTMKIWSLDNYEVIKTIEGFSSKVLMLDISPDNKLIAAGNANNLTIWNMSTFEMINS